MGDEYGAYSIRDDYLSRWSVRDTPPADLGLVQRTAQGDIRVLGPKNIAVRKGELWTTKDYKYSYVVEGIHLSARLEGEEISTLRETAALCVHGLSDRGIGATFVVKRTQGEFEDVEDLPDAERVAGLTVDDSRWHYALMALHAQKDGATLVRHSGEVEVIGVSLTVEPTNRWQRGALRHKYARAYSRAHRDCIVLVVSAEGPVTVFIGGAEVLPRDPTLERNSVDVPLPPCPSCSLAFLKEATSGVILSTCPACGATLPTELGGYVVRPYCPISSLANESRRWLEKKLLPGPCGGDVWRGRCF